MECTWTTIFLIAFVLSGVTFESCTVGGSFTISIREDGDCSKPIIANQTYMDGECNAFNGVYVVAVCSSATALPSVMIGLALVWATKML